jgi:hypothetical protein
VVAISLAALLSSAVSLVVGLVALGLCVLALRARARSGNRQLMFVGAAFALFVAKSVFSALDVASPLPHPVPHDYLELVLSLFDLGIIALLVMPFLLKAKP